MRQLKSACLWLVLLLLGSCDFPAYEDTNETQAPPDQIMVIANAVVMQFTSRGDVPEPGATSYSESAKLLSVYRQMDIYDKRSWQIKVTGIELDKLANSTTEFTTNVNMDYTYAPGQVYQARNGDIVLKIEHLGGDRFRGTFQGQLHEPNLGSGMQVTEGSFDITVNRIP